MEPRVRTVAVPWTRPAAGASRLRGCGLTTEYSVPMPLSGDWSTNRAASTVAVRVVAGGEGPVALFVHGTASSGRIWLKTLGRLCGPDAPGESRGELGTAILLDLPGMGDSEFAPDLSVEDWLSCIRQVAASLARGWNRGTAMARSGPSSGGTRVRLVGHSLGGALVTLLAGEDWVESTALVAPGTPEFGSDTLRKLGPGGRVGTVALKKVGGPLAFDPRRLSREDAVMLREDFKKARPLLESGLPWPVSLEGAASANDGGPGEGTGGAGFYGPASFTKPFLMVWGEEDKVVVPAYVKAWADYLSSKGVGVTRVPIPRCGHVPMLEYPDEVAQALAEFWRGDSSRASLTDEK